MAVFSTSGQMGVEEGPKQGWVPRLQSQLALACISALLLTSRMTLAYYLTAVNLIFYHLEIVLSALSSGYVSVK